MGILDRVLQRIGVVRTARYGLVVTPDDRILSLRPSVLDDGLGGKIVGWTQGDLAAMELEAWQLVSPRRQIQQPSPAHFAASVISISAPIAVPSMPRITPPVAVAAVAVAPAVEVEDDDWEWVIAVARAKAETAEVVEEVSSVTLLSGPPTQPVLVPPSFTVGEDTAVDTLAAKPAYVGRTPIATKPRGKGPTVVPLRPVVQLDPISRRPIRVAR